LSRAAKRTDVPLTTAQQLASLVKSARDIMRKDRGLSGDLDRLPQLTWIMFLKFLDDMEKVREQEAKLEGKRFRPAVETPYRWRDWACDECKLTGDDLTSFINSEEARGPDGKKGPGLFKYLRGLQGADGGDRRDVIASVFKDVVNRMVSGYLLRDVVSRVNGIHFDSTEEIHTLGNMYETMLREMRDAAGDSGEFYTPRPVIRFIVEVLSPKLGEVVLDPACGTGGFLVEAYKHLEKQCLTVEQHKILQKSSIIGGEAKPLPYLLCQMNLLLHGMEYPHVNYGNSLAARLSEIGDRDRVDIIMTNPPFGGEEEKGIQDNFPEDRKTSETALLFLQLLMRKLRRSPTPGRAAVVVPNGTLFGDGVCARIKEELLTEFNLHTIVRLPNGVFAPYTSIPTNLLFFDRSGPTKDIWFFELPLPEGRKQYTKTMPLQFEEFAPCLKWWSKRKANRQAWKVAAKDVLKKAEDGSVTVNLDIKNPSAKQGLEHLPPEQLVESIIEKEKRILVLMAEIKADLEKKP
jgi:type I restriction enzyme M protein